MKVREAKEKMDQARQRERRGGEKMGRRWK